MSATAEPPVVETTDIINPVLPDSFSKDNFNAELAKVTPKPAEASEPEPPVIPAPDPEKPIAEAPDAKKGDATGIPQELIDGKPAAAKKEPDPAVAEIEAMVLPKNAKPEQVASFAIIKEKAAKAINEKLARIAELETKTSEGASKAEIDAAESRVKAAETRSKELELTVERLAYTESPKFKQFIAEETASLDGAKAYIGGSEISPDIIDLAARTVGPNRIKLLKEAGLESDTISAIAPYLAQYDAIQRQKSAALDNWKTEATQHQQAEQQRSEAAKTQRVAQEDRVWTAVVAKAEAELLPFRKVESNAPWEAQREALKAEAKRVFNGDGVPLDQLADTIARGVAYGVLDKAFQALRETNNALTAENTKLKAAKPAGPITTGLDGGIAPSTAPLVELQKQTFRQELAKASGTA